MKQNVNNFTIKLANVNGTGSASANSLLMKAIFRMGVPVVGKNFFPSNIQGLPTWYEVRVSADGYHCRSGQVNLMVAMNAQTYAQDLAEISPGGYLLYDSTWPRSKELVRPDVTVLGVPLAQMCNAAFADARARILMKNMAYVGAVVALLDVDMEVVRELVAQTFSKKPALLDANITAIALGYDYAREHFDYPLPYRVARLDATAGQIMIDGNTAAAMGCLYAGATVGAWYPITPSTSLMDAFEKLCKRYRVDAETGEHNYAIIQAEDELAAIGMVMGANWNGARAFTPTSGPGISLMTEFLGFGYYTEIPAVLFDVQRSGPSTGLPTRTQQCDLLSCAYASHGDTRHVLLFPADPAECFSFAMAAFDLAEGLQTPVMVLSDLDIGMNDWMVPAFDFAEDYHWDRGKVLNARALDQMKEFNRYADVDGDGIPYRTLPGTHPNKGMYFVRGSGHNQSARYTESGQVYVEMMERLNRKFETAKNLVPRPIIEQKSGVSAAMISLGSCDGAVREARDLLATRGVEMNYLRVRGFPFHHSVEQFLAAHDCIYVIEQNRDAQLRTLLIIEAGADPVQLHSVLHYDGMPIAAQAVVDGILAAMNKEAAA